MDIPISKQQAEKASKWMKENFAPVMEAAVADTAYTINHLCGIACQESAYVWEDWLGIHPTETILASCILDASGDVPGKSRGAFPRNTAEFRKTYGPTFTGMLIAEANKMRKLRGMSPKDWVYKGYGIFQYDLQFVKKDRDFFEQKQWYAFDACLGKALGELSDIWDRVGKKYPGESKAEKLRLAIKAYNGSGAAADQYAENVLFYAKLAAAV